MFNRILPVSSLSTPSASTPGPLPCAFVFYMARGQKLCKRLWSWGPLEFSKTHSVLCEASRSRVVGRQDSGSLVTGQEVSGLERWQHEENDCRLHQWNNVTQRLRALTADGAAAMALVMLGIVEQINIRPVCAPFQGPLENLDKSLQDFKKEWKQLEPQGGFGCQKHWSWRSPGPCSPHAAEILQSHQQFLPRWGAACCGQRCACRSWVFSGEPSRIIWEIIGWAPRTLDLRAAKFVKDHFPY